MKRRIFCRGLAVMSAATVLPTAAQPAPMFRVAWVSTDQKNSPSPNLEAFRGGMRDLGYAESRDLVIEPWWGEGSSERVEQLASDIVRSQPDVIVAAGGLALFALIRAGVKTPIVFSISADPVEAKIIESFARPGGNVTGISLFTLAALLVCVMIAVLFVSAFFTPNVSRIVAALFVLAMIGLIDGLVSFLREVQLATASLRIG